MRVFISGHRRNTVGFRRASWLIPKGIGKGKGGGCGGWLGGERVM